MKMLCELGRPFADLPRTLPIDFEHDGKAGGEQASDVLAARAVPVIEDPRMLEERLRRAPSRETRASLTKK